MPILGSRSLWTSAAAALDPDTLAWVAAVVANGGSVSDARKAIVNNLIVGLKADSIFTTKHDRLWLLAGENEPSALIDLVALQLATTVNAPTFTIDRGYAGDGATSYIETGYGPSTGAVNFTTNEASVSAWCVTDRAAANTAITGAIGPGNTNSDLWPFTAVSAPTGLLVRINDAFTTLAGSSSRGFFTNNRSGASACEGYYNGSSLGSTADAAGGLSGATFAILAGQNSGHTLNAASTDQCAAVAYGGSLNATDAANLYSRLRTYMTAVGVP